MTVRPGWHSEDAERLVVLSKDAEYPQRMAMIAAAQVSATLEVAAAIDRQTEEMGTTVEIRQETR